MQEAFYKEKDVYKRQVQQRTRYAAGTDLVGPRKCWKCEQTGWYSEGNFRGRREKRNFAKGFFERKNACLHFGLEKKWEENGRQFFGRKEKACIYRKWICSKPG